MTAKVVNELRTPLSILNKGKQIMRKERIYVCHTYYHVYVTLLKEFALSKEELGGATIVLSHLSNDFGDLKVRLEKSGVFEAVLDYDEKNYTFFPELKKYKENKNNFLLNLINRVKFTKKFAKLQEKFIPTDFKQYKKIYVFCDSDPIGYYLNYKRIKYHAMEDGLNCLVHYDAARYDNRGMFRLKALMSAWNLIFVQNGYGKYCIDMEVNDISAITYPMKKYVECPRSVLEENLTDEEKRIIIDIFIEDKESIMGALENLDKEHKNYLILTEPLCSLDVRKQIFTDLIAEYKKEANITLKPHPRDEMDYKKEFPEENVIEKMVPMEVLNFFDGQPFDKVISVLTEVKGIRFAKECVRLGPDFMDKYEEAGIHRQNEQI